ncbi:unnamed protein product [Acanthoscelides obtectus]|uniref:Uncharacterized protein n=1 Tax=Acanthoscelides obtectus TaxID=200917 RepID=A0A9P0P6L8_ACAOB|nr:unnamed protein product [Acanthoscelides obtectus]CAK1668316.1 hypothetical protein AOBTE_LOCUS26326 [Acanthoscelides obtectus]
MNSTPINVMKVECIEPPLQLRQKNEGRQSSGQNGLQDGLCEFQTGGQLLVCTALQRGYAERRSFVKL